MPRFAANISMLFTELPFPQRFAAARAAGFRGVECLFPYAWSAREMRRWLSDSDLPLVLFNLPPGYLIDTPARALVAIEAVDRPNVRLQYDLYHASVMGEPLFQSLRDCLPFLEHVQFADAPGRHAPGSGELPLAELFAHLDGLGYRGWASAEYRPVGATATGLGWLPANLQGPSGSFPTTN